jgi:hypothetical protein
VNTQSPLLFTCLQYCFSFVMSLYALLLLCRYIMCLNEYQLILCGIMRMVDTNSGFLNVRFWCYQFTCNLLRVTRRLVCFHFLLLLTLLVIWFVFNFWHVQMFLMLKYCWTMDLGRYIYFLFWVGDLEILSLLFMFSFLLLIKNILRLDFTYLECGLNWVITICRSIPNTMFID